MRRIPALLALVSFAAAGLLFSGCASQTSVRPQDTVVLGGLYASRPGAFDQQTSTGLPINSDEPSRSKRMSGNKVSLFWGLITFRDQ